MSETATSEKQEMQDISDRVEAALFGSDEPKKDSDDDVASDDVIIDSDDVSDEDLVDEDELPDDDDTDSDEDDEGSDLDDIAAEDELSLADYLGIPEENLLVSDEGAVAFKAIIDGEAVEVPLTELAKSFQMQGHVNNKSIALETERREFHEKRDAALGEIQTRLQGATKLMDLAETELVSEYNRIDWDNLRVRKPEEWSAKRQEFAERAQKIKQTKELIGEESTRITEEQAKEIFEAQQKILKEETDKIITANPTWADEAVFKEAQVKMKDFLSSTYGYTDEDFATVMDSRLIALIQDAQKYREGTKTVKKKITKKVPKFRKPGANRKDSASLAKARKTKALKAKAKKTGHISDIANVLESRM